MRGFLLVLFASALAFVLGVVVGIGGVRYLESVAAGNVAVAGELQYQGQGDPSASALPPQGFYVEASGIERVYLVHPDAESYVGRTIRASGRLESLCGPDGTPCYPLVRPETISAQP